MINSSPAITHPHWPMNKEHGFTLIELIVTLAIAAILVNVAVPSMKTMIDNNRLTAATNRLVGALGYARSEAVKQGAIVTICSSNTAGNDCGSGADALWEHGWFVFIDSDSDGTPDSGEIMRVGDPLAGSVVVTATSPELAFNASGFAANNNPGTLTVCDNRSGNFGKTLRIMITGSLSLATDVTCP